MALPRTARLLAAGTLLEAGGLALAAAPASATDVSTEAALRAAFGDAAETTIVLTADIDLTDCVAGDLTRPDTGTALTLSGAFTIRQTCADERVIGSDSNPGGPIGALTIDAVTVTGGALTDATSATGGGIFWDGDVTVIESSLTGNLAAGGAEFGGTGGAIFGNSNVLIVRSTVAANVATASGDATSGGNGGGVVINANLVVAVPPTTTTSTPGSTTSTTPTTSTTLPGTPVATPVRATPTFAG